MKMVKSLLLGTAAGLVAVAGAQAADLPVKAKPVQYVKICSLYGAGFYYIPGTDTCIKIGGYVRAEWNYQAGGSFKPFLNTDSTHPYNFDDPSRDRYTERTRGGISVDVRSQTAYGTLRAYGIIFPTNTNDGGNGGSPYATTGVFNPAMFIQFAGFTFGKTASFFDFDTNPYTNATIHAGSNQAGNGIQVFAYTAQFGNGFSASLSAEDTTSRRSAITGPIVVSTAGSPAALSYNDVPTYGGRRWPDLVANLRIDQAWGSAQVMGAIHDVYAATDAKYTAGPIGAASTKSDTGWAVGAGLRINLPMIGAGDYLLGQVAYSEGAMNYLFNQAGSGGKVADLQSGFGPTASAFTINRALGILDDAVVTPTGSLDLTKGWSLTGGFEHIWNPQWKTSLYGTYAKFNYSGGASATLTANLIGTGAIAGGSTSADWSVWQVGSRTVWTPVANLDLSVDVLYSRVNTGFGGSTITPAAGATLTHFEDKDIVSAIFRAQRNFWP